MPAPGECWPVALFPYVPRSFQREAASLVEQTARQGGHLVLEAPTGTGKTIVLLSGALEAARALGKRVLYVTRTNSQQAQAVRELQAIREASGAPLRALALQGRARLCLKLEEASDPDLDDSSPEELSHFCSHAKRLTEQDPGSTRACRWYAGLLAKSDEDLEAWDGGVPQTAEQAKARARAGGFCSYEATKRRLPGAEVVIAPYAFAFQPGLRQRLLQWWSVEPHEVILVVDEAHNLPSYLREIGSPRLRRDRLRRAAKEADELGNPLLLRGVTAGDFLESLAEALDAIVREYCRDEDGFIPPFELETHLLSRFRTTTTGLMQAVNHLAQLSEVIRDRRRLAGRVPRSDVGRLAGFLSHWLAASEEGYVKLAGRDPATYLEAFLVDASEAALPLREFHATIHASGTLAPLAEYRDSLGLPPETPLERTPTPFDPDRLRVLVARGLSTRFERLKSDPKLVDRLQETTRQLVAASRTSTAVFFPSHQLLDEFEEVGVFDGESGSTLVERRGMPQETLMGLVAQHRIRQGRSLLVGVLGGRLSEGLDFPGRELEAVIVVGAPFPKPTAHQRALFHYYESRMGQGWEYAVKAPTVRRLRQALGRLIRGPEDRGLAVVLDERAAALLAEAGVACSTAGPDELVAAWRRGHGALAAGQAWTDDDTFKSTPGLCAQDSDGPPA